MKDEKQLTLLELNRLVRAAIEVELPEEYWVEAELSECKEARQGHCYMELIEKDEKTNTPVARASAKCWAQKWLLIRPHFERITGQSLSPGMKVLLKVYPQFHEAYGFSWIVTDIDPTYTLGDMARRRQEIIRQLKEEGVYDLQRDLRLPLFCQKIAVISSESAAGYGDFLRQLQDNPYGFRFETRLFPATMQGEGVEQSVIDALETIYSLATETAPDLATFDCVVIIRGGGATADLSGFDTLRLAENVANFPLPIITGIGHERDESILDLVSHLRVKTPTAAADYLISRLKEVGDTIDNSRERIARYTQQRLTQLSTRLTAMQESLPRLFTIVKTRQEARLDSIEERLPQLLQRLITDRQHRLELLSEKAKALDPQLLLKRGYSITLKDGKAVKDASALKAGDLIETRIEKGTIKSIVT